MADLHQQDEIILQFFAVTSGLQPPVVWCAYTSLDTITSYKERRPRQRLVELHDLRWRFNRLYWLQRRRPQ
jgi:hypothetical protein